MTGPTIVARPPVRLTPPSTTASCSPSGERVLLYTYVCRVQEPALERRYTLVLSASAEGVHQGVLRRPVHPEPVVAATLERADLAADRQVGRRRVGLRGGEVQDDRIGRNLTGSSRAKARPGHRG